MHLVVDDVAVDLKRRGSKKQGEEIGQICALFLAFQPERERAFPHLMIHGVDDVVEATLLVSGEILCESTKSVGRGDEGRKETEAGSVNCKQRGIETVKRE
jgi:hypothetical protein